jgi:hypothetical protein
MFPFRSHKLPVKKRKTLRELLRENPNSQQHVVGEGLVRVDPSVIRNSRRYKDDMKKIEALAKEFCKARDNHRLHCS